MLRRLRIYFTGFALGLIVVYFIFSKSDDRNLDIWTPSQRILEEIRNDTLFQTSAQLACYVDCMNLKSEQLMELWIDGNTESLNPGGEPYRYLISLATDERELEAEIEWKKGQSRKLVSLIDKRNPKNCHCSE